MDYRQAYIRLIERAKGRTREDLDPSERYEWHHYFPVCFWRDRQANNKTVPLTLREHWIAHRLLFAMFPCQGTAAALAFMSKRDNKMNSRKFEKIRSAISNHNWAKTPEGRSMLSEAATKGWEAGIYATEKAKAAWSRQANRLQAEWKENGKHPLSSEAARLASSERAKLRNKTMNAWLNKEKGKVVRTCDKCGMQIKGTMGNMTRHQRGSKCRPIEQGLQ